MPLNTIHVPMQSVKGCGCCNPTVRSATPSATTKKWDSCNAWLHTGKMHVRQGVADIHHKVPKKYAPIAKYAGFSTVQCAAACCPVIVQAVHSCFLFPASIICSLHQVLVSRCSRAPHIRHAGTRGQKASPIP